MADLVPNKEPFVWKSDFPSTYSVIKVEAGKPADKKAARYQKGELPGNGSEPVAIPVDPKSTAGLTGELLIQRLNKAVYDLRISLDGNKENPTNETPGLVKQAEDLANDSTRHRSTSKLQSRDNDSAALAFGKLQRGVSNAPASTASSRMRTTEHGAGRPRSASGGDGSGLASVGVVIVFAPKGASSGEARGNLRRSMADNPPLSTRQPLGRAKIAPTVAEGASPTALEAWAGRIIGGKYRVDAVLGKGGMGVVLRATHLRLGEPVAIKVLLPAMLDVPGMVARFMREARAASKIKSVHVVRVTDVDTLEDGVPYMVMEFLEGTDLAALRRKEGPLQISDAVRYLLEACDAIAEAHSLGIVHRDLKPGNLFIARTRDGVNVLKVLDFGISKLDAADDQDTTKTGQMMGSPKYMSPEQMLSMHDVDGRSDIWSLGAILYELVTGRPPFIAESAPRVCALVLNEAPQRPSVYRPDMPRDLDKIILRCLEKDPENRYANVGELADALSPFAPMGEYTRLGGSRFRIPRLGTPDAQ